MNGVILAIFGTMIIFPFTITLTVLLLRRTRGKVPATVIGLAADVTTPFLFLTVYVVSCTITGKGMGIYIAGIAIIIAIVHIVIERINVKEFRIVRLLRKTWRLYFIVLAVVYVLLLFVGTLAKIVEYVS